MCCFFSAFGLFVFAASSSQCDHGECGSLQRAGILPSPQTAEHQESGQVVPNLEGQAQVGML